MIKVLYFSRNGNGKRIAEKIAKKTGCHISVITDDKNWKGPLGFIKGGFYATTWKLTRPTVSPPVTWEQYEHIIIISPLWANNVAPAIYSLIQKEVNLKSRLVLVLNNSGSEVDVAFKKIEAKLGHMPLKFGITKSKNNEDQVIDEITKAVKK